jgi:hypothetical protein
MKMLQADLKFGQASGALRGFPFLLTVYSELSTIYRMIRRVGNGENIRIWDDSWTPSENNNAIYVQWTKAHIIIYHVNALLKKVF